MLGLIPLPYKLLALAALAASAWLHGYFSNHQADTVQEAWDHAVAVANAARTERIIRARAAERELQAFADEDRRRRNAEESRLTARVDALSRELRNRPERPPAGAGPADVRPGPAGPGPALGCTGASLYRDDGEFLARYAAAANVARAERDACYRQYGEAQRKLRARGR